MPWCFFVLTMCKLTLIRERTTTTMFLKGTSVYNKIIVEVRDGGYIGDHRGDELNIWLNGSYINYVNSGQSLRSWNKV